MTKYYLRQNNSQVPIRSGGFEFQFDSVASAGGSVYGILSVSNPAHIAALTKIVGSQGVMEVPKNTFEYWEKKKGTPVASKGTTFNSPPLLEALDPTPPKEKAPAHSAHEDAVTGENEEARARAVDIDDVLTPKDVDGDAEYASSLAKLAEAVGVPVSTLNYRLKREGAPVKGERGYNVAEVRLFIASE